MASTLLIRQFYRSNKIFLPSICKFCTTNKKPPLDNAIKKSLDFDKPRDFDKPIENRDRNLALSQKTLGIDDIRKPTNQKSAFDSTNQKTADDNSTNQKMANDDSTNQKEANDVIDDLTAINEARIAEIMEYYSQYEKELMEGGYKDPETEKWVETETVSDEEKYPISLTRGKEGVFDLDEMVVVMENQRMVDICVIKVPKEIGYVDYMVIGTAFSMRHLTATHQYILTLYKKKRGPMDIPGFGKSPKQVDWAPLELGNLVVHLMTKEIRKKYDIEMLWAVGPEFDDLTNEKSEIEDFQEQFEKFRRDIQMKQA